MAAHDNGATTNEAPRADDEATHKNMINRRGAGSSEAVPAIDRFTVDRQDASNAPTGGACKRFCRAVNLITSKLRVRGRTSKSTCFSGRGRACDRDDAGHAISRTSRQARSGIGSGSGWGYCSQELVLLATWEPKCDWLFCGRPFLSDAIFTGNSPKKVST